VPDELLAIHGCENEQRVGDVVFVHGLNGNARDYWCYEGKPENYWPAWLGEDLPEVGIWSLGYENAAFKTRKLTFLRRSGYRGFAMPLSDRAKSVQLQLANRDIGKRPLVFVAHSMGGLLVKQLLRTASEKSSQKSWNGILRNTRGVCFIATPHIGSELARWASYFRTLLGVNISIEELGPHGSLLRDLNDSYVTVATRKGSKIKTLSFIEKKPLISGILVVAEGDATLHVLGGMDYPLGEDHISICKPRSNSSDIHIKLVKFIRNDCFQLTTNLPSLPEQTHGSPSPSAGPPWRPEPMVTPEYQASESRRRFIERAKKTGIILLIAAPFLEKLITRSIIFIPQYIKAIGYIWRDKHRERFVDADIFKRIFTIYNKKDYPVYINSVYFFHGDAFEAAAPAPMFASKVSTFRDRLYLGVISKEGLFVTPPTAPIPLPGNLNRDGVMINRHPFSGKIKINDINHKSFLFDKKNDHTLNKHKLLPISEATRLLRDQNGRLYCPTYKIFGNRRLKLGPKEQVDFDFDIVIKRPDPTELAAAKDLNIQSFIVVVFEVEGDPDTQDYLYFDAEVYLW
jgi:hypothetical protein